MKSTRYSKIQEAWKQNRGRSFHTWCYQLVLIRARLNDWCLIATAELRVEWRADQVRASFSEVWSPQQLCIAHSVQRGATHHVGNIKSNIIQSLNENLPFFLIWYKFILQHFTQKGVGGQGPVASDLPHEQEMDKEKQELLGRERENKTEF